MNTISYLVKYQVDGLWFEDFDYPTFNLAIERARELKDCDPKLYRASDAIVVVEVKEKLCLYVS